MILKKYQSLNLDKSFYFTSSGIKTVAVKKEADQVLYYSGDFPSTD